MAPIRWTDYRTLTPTKNPSELQERNHRREETATRDRSKTRAVCLHHPSHGRFRHAEEVRYKAENSVRS